MAKQIINTGTNANDRTGDTLRSAFTKINSNFTELYTSGVGAGGATGATGPQGVQGASGVSSGSSIDLSAVSQSIIPDTDSAYDLGAIGARWKDLHLSGNTIYIGGQQISASASGIVLPGIVPQDGAWGVYDLGYDITTSTGPDGITCITAVATPNSLIGAGPFTVAPIIRDSNDTNLANPAKFNVTLDQNGYVTDVTITDPGVYPAADRSFIGSDGCFAYIDSSEPWELEFQSGGNYVVNNECVANNYLTDLTDFPEGAYTGTITIGSVSIYLHFNAYKDPFYPTQFSSFILHSVTVNGGSENFTDPINGFTLAEYNQFAENYTILINANSQTVTQHLNSPSDGELNGTNNATISFWSLNAGRAQYAKTAENGSIGYEHAIGFTAKAPLTSAQAISTVNGNFTGNVRVSGDLTVTGDIHVNPNSLYLGSLKLSTNDGSTLLVNDAPLIGTSTDGITRTVSGDTFNGTPVVIWSGTNQNITSVKMTIQIEGWETGDSSGWHTQTCEATIADRYWGNAGALDPVISVYGVVHTSTAPLATLTVQRNPTSHVIEVLATPTVAANGILYPKVHSVELTTRD